MSSQVLPGPTTPALLPTAFPASCRQRGAARGPGAAAHPDHAGRSDRAVAADHDHRAHHRAAGRRDRGPGHGIRADRRVARIVVHVADGRPHRGQDAPQNLRWIGDRAGDGTLTATPAGTPGTATPPRDGSRRNEASAQERDEDDVRQWAHENACQAHWCTMGPGGCSTPRDAAAQDRDRGDRGGTRPYRGRCCDGHARPCAWRPPYVPGFTLPASAGAAGCPGLLQRCQLPPA